MKIVLQDNISLNSKDLEKYIKLSEFSLDWSDEIQLTRWVTLMREAVVSLVLEIKRMNQCSHIDAIVGNADGNNYCNRCGAFIT